MLTENYLNYSCDILNTTEAGIADEVKEPINGLEVEQSMADALGLLREANLEQSQLTAQTTDCVQSTEAGVLLMRWRNPEAA
ncbi:hypothetical protein C4D60_Mb01t27240 [Musa balbisiana]|uniref:Uncharacterized protein n=1 Tax=Musa balbisiana TaxID=52838 RepID=A0A4S8JR37_MUSBA|nr:hypothetical protein C4D60_Mb01t27240 [Musa balbisiana]